MRDDSRSEELALLPLIPILLFEEGRVKGLRSNSTVHFENHHHQNQLCPPVSSPTMFARVLESPQEQSAFVSLLEEYFQGPPPVPPSSSSPLPRSLPPHAVTPSPARSTPPKPAGLNSSTSSSSTRPAGLVTTNPSNSTSTPVPPSSSTESFSSRLQTQAAGAALRNTTATSSALRQAGLSQGAANSIAGFGAKHHQTLAPHVANAARQSVTMQMQQEEQGAGPKKPTGLQSSKSERFLVIFSSFSRKLIGLLLRKPTGMAGVGDTSSGKNVSFASLSHNLLSLA